MIEELDNLILAEQCLNQLLIIPLPWPKQWRRQGRAEGEGARGMAVISRCLPLNLNVNHFMKLLNCRSLFPIY